MALRLCPECSGSVPSEAAICPLCGHPLKKVKEAREPMASRAGGCLLQLVAAALLIWSVADFVNPEKISVYTIGKALFGVILLYIGGWIKAL
jgi:hypothetical protein